MSLPPLAIMEARCRELEHELAHATRELRRLREKDADARILAATREHAEDELSDLMQKRSLERSRRRKLLEILASELSAATDGIITVSHSDKTVKDQLECLVLTTRGGSASLDSDSTQDDPLNGVKSMCACRMLLSQQMLAIVFVGRFRQAEIPRQSKISDIEKVQVRRHEPETAWRTVILHLPNRVRTLLVPPSLSAVALLRQLRSILPKDSWHETFDEETATTDESHETPSVASEEREPGHNIVRRLGALVLTPVRHSYYATIGAFQPGPGPAVMAGDSDVSRSDCKKAETTQLALETDVGQDDNDTTDTPSDRESPPSDLNDSQAESAQ